MDRVDHTEAQLSPLRGTECKFTYKPCALLLICLQTVKLCTQTHTKCFLTDSLQLDNSDLQSVLVVMNIFT